MAEACSIASLSQLAWTADWHIRDETYLMALRCLVNQQQREPFAANFGHGKASSSDGQFFQAAGFGRERRPPERPLQPEAGVQGLHPPVGSVWALLHQADRGHGERGAARAGRAALSSERGFIPAAPHRRRRRFRPCLCPMHPGWLPIRAAHSGSEAPAALQLRQAVRLPCTRTDDRRPHRSQAA